MLRINNIKIIIKNINPLMTIDHIDKLILSMLLRIYCQPSFHFSQLFLICHYNPKKYWNFTSRFIVFY